MKYEAYIGLADDPDFQWEGGDWSCNIPKQISPVFPGVHRKKDDLIHGEPQSMRNTSWNFAIEDFGLQMVRLDWGAYGAKISKARILELLERFGSTDELTACVQDFDDQIEYALILLETDLGSLEFSEELDEWIDLEDLDDLKKLKSVSGDDA